MLSKLIMCIGLILRILFGRYEVVDWEKILSSAKSINIYYEGEQIEIYSYDEYFAKVLEGFFEMIQDGADMPAFGVSLDEETRRAIKSGMWLEFVFDEVKMYNDMPFESLLIEVSSDYSGFNLIRKVDGKYEGRCFYINLFEKDMSKMFLMLKIVCEK